ncbi:SprB repeat-containing protein [Parachryseolinea silvisoli]|uniref:SprB repeat-containing protein n=1 Tax=Parachryseolinea silvisoli TaxID=2873601 RepID=UPI002265F39D|nr:SprB repeat-containing protein [Parachryseolinea silvisoli]MCD9015072.1 SprB repeat-containing protein [Parachryseolinea silvisoli]
MMKKLVGAFLLVALITTQAVSQSDFSSQYLIRLRGFALYNGDLSEGCGSRIDIYVNYQGGQRRQVYGGQHGGGQHNFAIDLPFDSKNKIKSVECFARAHRQGNWTQSCRRRKIGEGTAFIQLDTTASYPCHKQKYLGKFPYLDGRSEVNVEIIPFSKSSVRLVVDSDLRNNSNENLANDPAIDLNDPQGLRLSPAKTDFRYTITAVGPQGNSQLLAEAYDGYTEIGPDPIVRQTIIYDGAWKKPTSINVSASGNAWLGQNWTDENGNSYFIPIAARPQAASIDIPLPDILVPGTVSVPYVLFPGATTSQLRITTTGYSFPIKYGPDNTNILPYDSRVTVLAPAWNPASFYHWVYSLDGINWKDFPAQFQGKHRLQISGYDLEGEEFMKNPVANRFIKLIIDCNGGESSVLTLSGRISAPQIVGVAPLHDRCFDRPRDGAFTITFRRPLLVDENGNREQLTILVRDLSNTNPPDQVIDVTLDAQNSFTWPRRLQSDKEYEITLLDTYLGTFGYTGNRQFHYANVALVRPQPVSSVVAAEDVHCYGGSDGKINLQARGGVGNFVFDYVVAGTEDSLHLSLGVETEAVLSLLPPATYYVMLRDANRCKDQNGVKTMVVHQPNAALRIGYSAITHPLGYGYEDGYIETILTGGTPYPDKHYTTEWYNPTDLVSDVLYNNAPLSEGYKANLDSIGDGSYILRAFDSQYTLAHPDHRAGCYVASEIFHVIQPPPIVVTLSEYHYVTCNGFDDGEVLASAQGGVQMTGPLPYQYEWLIVEDAGTRPINQDDSIAIRLRSGTYRIRITDKNRVQKLSSPFFLVQPDVLAAQITGTPVSCDSGADGTALATVQGGTLPYVYEWSDGTTLQQTGNLAAGTYFVFVADVRGCTTTASGKVESPFPIQVDSVLRAPQCFGYNNGAIDLTVANGTAPYQYAWSTGATTEDMAGLTEGTYEVVITDGNNCKSVHTYTLVDPAPVLVDLGQTRFLCNSQHYEADASLNDEGAQYQWTGPAGFTATTGIITITQAGTYHVLVTDANGCDGEDELVVQRQTLDINAEFVVSTQGFSATDVTLLNISSTPSDSVQWWTSDPLAEQFSLREDNKAVVAFSEEGVYTLYMKAYRQGCEAVFSKTITVLGTSFVVNPPTATSFIETFTASPVPSNGPFTVTVKMKESSRIQLRLIALGDNRLVDERTAQGSNEYVLPYMVNLAAGTYLLLLESTNGDALLKVVIQ